MSSILTGESARTLYNSLKELSQFPYGDQRVSGYFRTGEGFTAFDNRSLDFWTDSFTTLAEAVNFCLGLEQAEL